jgi:hypothetical protein
MPKDIETYIASLPDQAQKDIQLLHEYIQSWLPNAALSFSNGLNQEQKVVSNPIIGYGSYQHRWIQIKND